MKTIILPFVLAVNLFSVTAYGKFTIVPSPAVAIQIPDPTAINKDFIGASYDGDYFYLMTQNCRLLTFNSETGALVHQVALGSVNSYCASFAINDLDPNSPLVAVRITDFGTSRVMVSLIKSGELKWSYEILGNNGMGNDLSQASFALSWSKDGKYLIAPSLSSSQIDIRGAQDGSLVYRHMFPFSEFGSENTQLFFYENGRLTFEQDAGFYWFNTSGGPNPLGTFFTKQTYYDFLVDVSGDELRRVHYDDVRCSNGFNAYRLKLSTIELKSTLEAQKFNLDICDGEDPSVQPYISHSLLLSHSWFSGSNLHVGSVIDADDGALAYKFNVNAEYVRFNIARDGNKLIVVYRNQYNAGDFWLQTLTVVR